MAHQPDALVYGLSIYYTWRKPQRICEEMPECADRFLVEWILAWRVLEFCCVGTDPWNLYGCGYVLLADKER